MPVLTLPVIPGGSLGRRPQPVLRSADGELALRPFEPADAEAVREAYADPDIRRWHARGMDSVDEAREWIAASATHWSAERRAEWAVAPADGGGMPGGRPLIGRVTVRTWDLHEGLAVVGYWVLPAARGAGVARRAVRTAADWAFSAGFHRLELDHATGNAASCRVAEHAGFAPEGTRRSASLHEEGWLDMHVHARIAPGTSR